MVRFNKYARKALSSDIKSFYYNFCDKFYPFFQYKRSINGKDIPIYENSAFILEVLLAIIIIPIFIIALLLWNIARVFPTDRYFAHSFPDKVFDLAMGKDREDYFNEKVSKVAFKEAFIKELKEITGEDNISSPQDFMKEVDIHALYCKLKPTAREKIKKSFRSLISEITKKPIESFTDKVASCFSWATIPPDHQVINNNIRKNVSNNINFGGHLWLNFIRHLYRTYIPWEESGLIQKGQANSLFHSIDSCIDECGSLDDISLFGERGEVALNELNKHVEKKFIDPNGGYNSEVVLKFAFVWYITDTLRWKNFKKNKSSDYSGDIDNLEVYIVGNKNCETMYGSTKKVHASSLAGQASQKLGDHVKYYAIDTISSIEEAANSSKKSSFFSIKNKTSLPSIPGEFNKKNAARVHIQEHIENINKSNDPEDVARNKSPVWLNSDYFFTGETISKRDYLSLYNHDPDDIKGHETWPDYLPIIQSKKDFSSLLKSEPTPIEYDLILALPRLVGALLITIFQAIIMLLQLAISIIVAIVPFIYTCIYTPVTSKVGQCVSSIVGLSISLLILIELSTNSLPIVALVTQSSIGFLSSCGWGSAAAASLFNTFSVILFFNSLMLAIYSYKNIMADEFSSKDEVESLQNIRYNFSFTSITLVLFIASIAIFSYPGLLLSSASINALVGIVGNFGIGFCIISTLVFSSVFMLGIFGSTSNNDSFVSSISRESSPRSGRNSASLFGGEVIPGTTTNHASDRPSMNGSPFNRQTSLL